MKDAILLGGLVLLTAMILKSAADSKQREERQYRALKERTHHLHVPPMQESEFKILHEPIAKQVSLPTGKKPNNVNRRPTGREKFIADMSKIAKDLSKKLEGKIPASLIVAQAVLESNYGESRLAKQANNFFGHKWRPSHGNRWILADDDQPKERFTKYASRWASINAHTRILMSPLYWGRLKGKPTLENWLNALCGNSNSVESKKFVKRGGSVYATACYNSCYACKLRGIIKQWNLDKLDK